MLRALRPDGVRRHARVAEPRDKHAARMLAEQQPEFRRDGARGAQAASAVFLQRREVERDIPPAGLAEPLGGAFRFNVHARHAAPAAKDRPALRAGDRRAALRAEQLVRLHGKVSAILEHVVTFLLLNLVCKPILSTKFCVIQKIKNCEKMLAISCILC